MSPVPLPSAIAFSRISKLVKRESILKTFQTIAHDAVSVVIMLRINCRPLVTVKMTSIFLCTKAVEECNHANCISRNGICCRRGSQESV